MPTLDAIIFDFDGVVADCQRSVLLPGAAAFVRDAAQHVPLGIASGAVTRDIEDLLDRHELRDAFTAIVGIDQALRTKPSPDPYLEALHRINVAGFAAVAARTVAIDDSLWGLVAARSAHLRCVGVASAARAAEFAPHAELIVSGLAALSLDMLVTLVTTET
jgi:beta-phosphoglucomutase-like phosphatase (HAD superfamily)